MIKSTTLSSDPKCLDALEMRTRAIGREIFAQIDTSGPSVFNRQWWDDWVMDWSMAHESVKVQMFRFIDVLPMLQDSEQIAEHLQAYFSEGDGLDHGHFPLLVRLGASLAEPGTMQGRMIARAIRQNVSRMARRFIAGSNPAEVIETVKGLRADGMTFTMDLLGEATITEREADEYLKQYLELLDALGPEARRWTENPRLDRAPDGPLPRVNLSIKMTALFSQFDPIDPEGCYRVVAGRLREVFRSARRHGAIINVDMEQYAIKDATLYILRRLLDEPEFRDWPDAGIAVQAYIRDTEGDLRNLLDWAKRRGTPIWVRLVKGAYWDFETVFAKQMHWPTPVFTQKWQSDACFERCSSFLLENRRWLKPAIASHNVRSMAHALAVAERLGIPQGAYELQMLYGMGDPLKKAFIERGERLRIYTPFGKLLPGMAYLVRRLLENTSNTSFLRATFTEHTSIDRLLRQPEEVGADHQEPAMESNRTPENLPPFVNEPLLDFSRDYHRSEMRAAIARVRQRFGSEIPLWINGKMVSSNQFLESRNPANPAELIAKVAKATVAQADEAVAVAKSAFSSWSRSSVWKRVDVLFETARIMRRKRLELAAWMVLECGKQWREADADVAEAIDFCEYYGRAMLELSAPRERNIPGEDNLYHYLPRGVAVVISPWNFPLAILCGMAMAPLVAGNTVILKPAEQSNAIAAQFVEILKSLDLPPGVVNFVPGIGEEVGQRLVEHPDVAIITFTGSVPVGMTIQKTAALQAPGQKHVKRVVAEMGGKNAIIIDDDADLDEAVKGVVGSAFGYQGQKCSACSRVIVLPKIHDLFLARLREAIGSLSMGPPEDPAYTIGPVIDKEAFERLNRWIADAKEEAECAAALDPGPLAKSGYYVGPHLFSNARPEGKLGQVEFFGPVLAVFRARDLTHALEIANGTNYALTGGIYSRNPDSLDRARREFAVGNLYINRKITGALVDLQPFGGFNLSGIGAKAGGPDYLHQFLTPRTVTENTLRRGFAPEES